MMSVVSLDHDVTLYRVGRHPDPVAWTPIGADRFDDPRKQCRVLYAAESVLPAFLDSLAPFRQSVDELLPLLHAMPASHNRTAAHIPGNRVPLNWHLRRMIGVVRIYPGQRWLDFRATETHTCLTRVFADELNQLGYDVLDARVAVGLDRPFTQMVSRWTYEQGYRGIRYTSRIDTRYTCTAIFEGAGFINEGATPTLRDNPALVMAARALGLEIVP